MTTAPQCILLRLPRKSSYISNSYSNFTSFQNFLFSDIHLWKRKQLVMPRRSVPPAPTLSLDPMSSRCRRCELAVCSPMTSTKWCFQRGSVRSNDRTGSPDVARCRCLDQLHWFAQVVAPTASCLGYLISKHSLKWFVFPSAIGLN